MLTGLAIGALGLFAMIAAEPHTPYGALILPLMAIGFGTAYTMPAATATAIDAAPSHQAGVASGTLNASRQIGSTLGIAVFGAIVASTTFMTGYHLSVLIGGTVFALAATVTFYAIPKPQASVADVSDRRPS